MTETNGTDTGFLPDGSTCLDLHNQQQSRPNVGQGDWCKKSFVINVNKGYLYLICMCVVGASSKGQVTALQLPETVQIHTGVVLERAHVLNDLFHQVRLEHSRKRDKYDENLAYYDNHVKMFDIEIIKFQTVYNNVIASHWIKAYKRENTRKKRSWFDAGGSLLKTVFGVALDSDVRSIEKKVNFLENQELGNSEILVSLRDQLKENHNALMHVEKEIDKLRHDSSGLHAQLNLLSYVTLATSYLRSLNNFLGTVQ